MRAYPRFGKHHRIAGIVTKTTEPALAIPGRDLGMQTNGDKTKTREKYCFHGKMFPQSYRHGPEKRRTTKRRIRTNWLHPAQPENLSPTHSSFRD
jgi:hypothetical protein